MITLPFWSQLESAKSILIAGAGGGFDVYSGLPLYFALQNAGKRVHLANLSFSRLRPHQGEHLLPTLARVDAHFPEFADTNYFPEKRLSEWFAAQGQNVPIYTFYRTGVRPLREGYELLTSQLELDTVLLVDGGTDSLMRGDEYGLGTPEEDSASIAAVDALNVPTKILACLGFGVDAFHGVCHAHFLESVAAITRGGGYLGAFSLTPDMAESIRFRDAVKYVMSRMPGRESIVCTSIVAALEGEFGDHHTTDRTQHSELFINPLMPIYWTLRLDYVARRHLYLDLIRDTVDYFELKRAIDQFEISRKSIRPSRSLPM